MSSRKDKGRYSIGKIYGNSFDDEMYNIRFEDLEITAQIGKGSFGRVFVGKYLGTDVAIKQIYKDETQRDELERFLQRELAISKLSHPNIVQLIGVCDEEDFVYLITEFISGGDLRKQLKDPTVKISWKLRVSIAIDVAKAITFLHSKKIIHRDLKSKNLLVDYGWKIKVCDFGFARRLDKRQQFMTICGTDDWMAPEVLLGLEYNEMADVFGFGVVLAEIITAKKITVDLRRSPEEAFALDRNKLRSMVLPDCPIEFLHLTLQCCKWDPEKRPNFRAILQRLEDIRDTKFGSADRIGPGQQEHPENRMPQTIQKKDPQAPNPTKSQVQHEKPMKWKKTMGGREKFLVDISTLTLLSIKEVEKLNDALHHVLDHNSYSGWLLVGYTSEKVLALQKFGSGGIEELKSNLRDDEIQYALLRVDMGSKKTRDVLIFWTGKNVSLMQKGVKKSFEGEVKKIIKPVHAEIFVSSRLNFTKENVVEKSNPLSGSHEIA